MSLALLATTGFAASLEELNLLARSGRIQGDAPVRTEVQMRIGALPAVVWALLIKAIQPVVTDKSALVAKDRLFSRVLLDVN